MHASRARGRRDAAFSHTELTVALSVAAITLWVTIVWYVISAQPLLGGDFVQFYVLGVAGRAGDWALQYDWPRLHDLQIALVPASQGYAYAPAYPPLLAALYVPLAAVRFEVAYALYALATALAYTMGTVLAARGCRVVSRTHAVLICLLLPAFIMHTVMGQTTILALAGFVGGWWALQNGRPFIAGIVLSLVSLKPHFGMAMAIVLPLTGSWRVVGGVGSGVVLHAVLTFVVCGVAASTLYFDTTGALLRDPSIIEPIQSDISQAWRASLHGVLPPVYVAVIWLIVGLAICGLAIRVWRRTEAWTLRMASLLIATFLVTPHAVGYDGILLAPAALWMLDWSLGMKDRVLSALLGLTVLGVAIPVSALAGFPLTAAAALCALWRLHHQLRRPTAQRPRMDEERAATGAVSNS